MTAPKVEPTSIPFGPSPYLESMVCVLYLHIHTGNAAVNSGRCVVPDSRADSSIESRVCTRSDEAELASFLGQVFSARDPPAMAVGITPGEFEALVSLFAPRASEQALTMIARESSSEEMVGALLAEDAASEMPHGIDQLSAKFDPIFDILGQLDDEYRRDQRRAPGEELHVFLIGVAAHMAGRGIAKRLVDECLACASARGFRRAVVETTNPISRKLFRSKGFIERAQRSYADHRFDGRAVFASIADQGGPILMDRPLPLGTADRR